MSSNEFQSKPLAVCGNSIGISPKLARTRADRIEITVATGQASYSQSQCARNPNEVFPVTNSTIFWQKDILPTWKNQTHEAPWNQLRKRSLEILFDAEPKFKIQLFIQKVRSKSDEPWCAGAEATHMRCTTVSRRPGEARPTRGGRNTIFPQGNTINARTPLFSGHSEKYSEILCVYLCSAPLRCDAVRPDSMRVPYKHQRTVELDGLAHVEEEPPERRGQPVDAGLHIFLPSRQPKLPRFP